jgi:hypothetical protein
MNDQPMNSVINATVRAGFEDLKRQAVEERVRREAAAADRRCEQIERQASYAIAMRQTLAAFR